MLAFVANTTASWESYMNTIDDREKDHAPDLLAVAESGASTRLPAKRDTFVVPSRVEPMCGARADSRSRFLIVLLRALSAWPV